MFKKNYLIIPAVLNHENMVLIEHPSQAQTSEILWILMIYVAVQGVFILHSSEIFSDWIIGEEHFLYSVVSVWNLNMKNIQ